MKGDEPRSNSYHPMTPEEFEKLFDHSGRLVDEHELRRAIFKGGVIESIRKEVWRFLFELYPFNTTAREREILKVEQTVRYEAMKIRWKKLLKTLVSDYEGVAYCPKWYTGCSKPKVQSTVIPETSIDNGEVDKLETTCPESISLKYVPDEGGTFDFTSASTDTESGNHVADCEKTFDVENPKSEEVCGETICGAVSIPTSDTFCNKVVTISPSVPTTNNHEKSEQCTIFDTTSYTSPDQELIDTNGESSNSESNFHKTINEKMFCKMCDNDSVKCAHAGRICTNLPSNAILNTNGDEKCGRDTHFNSIPIVNDVPSTSIHSCLKDTKYIPTDHPVTTSISISCLSNNEFITEVCSTAQDAAEEDSLEDKWNSCETLDTVDMNVVGIHDIGESFLANKNTNGGEKRSDIIKSEFDNDELETIENPISLSTEYLQKLPSWIAQVINASTPPKRKHNKKLHFIKERKTSKYPCDEFIRAMDEDVTKHRELLDIIENANKYLKERGNVPCSPVNNSMEELRASPYHSETINQSENGLHDLSDEADTSICSYTTPVSSCGVDIYEIPHFQLVTNDDTDFVDSTCPYCNYNPEDSPKILLPSSLGEDQLKFMQIQAQVYAERQPYNSGLVSESIRVIDKDVPRTDRELSLFQGNENIGLVKLRDALLTYAFFNPDVGYAQGMNDIMARFLVVMDIESEAYWMFVHYMEHFKQHFMEEGVLKKVSLVEQLLMKMDRDLYDFLQSTDLGLMFCHRWLLLNFKREFEYNEAIRIFEITSSRHLEVSSMEAELERSKQRAKDSGGSHMEEIYISPDIPFDIFVCVAMLTECRHLLMHTPDVSAMYEILSNLPTTLDLQTILEKAEELFYRYCRRTVDDCFQVIDELEAQDLK